LFVRNPEAFLQRRSAYRLPDGNLLSSGAGHEARLPAGGGDHSLWGGVPQAGFGLTRTSVNHHRHRRHHRRHRHRRRRR
ncbi:MAG: hypothetical protein AAF283_05310, partial [Cyanobacteria bacterium P01_A01_bin.70]